MMNGQFDKALPLLERSLSLRRENLPGDHVDLTHGEIVCILFGSDSVTINGSTNNDPSVNSVWFVCP